MSHHRVALLAAVIVAIATGCSDDDVADSPPSSTTTSVSPPSSTVSTDPVPGLNPLEARIADALSHLELNAERAESSVRGAVMRSELSAGGELYVTGHPRDTIAGEFSVISERDVSGVQVREVDYPAAGRRSQFDCDEIRYEVFGAAPPGYDERDAFLADLIGALGCSSTN